MPEWIDIENDAKHVGREKKKAKELGNTQWWKQKLANGICHYCEKKFPPEDLTMDHIVPLSRGGRSTKGNIVPSCRDCNQDKKYYTPVEFILDRLKEG